MTAKGWMVIAGALVLTMTLASCAKSNNNEKHDHGLNCAEFQSFSSSGIQYYQEGGKVVAINGVNQRYVLKDGETPASLQANCMSNSAMIAPPGYYSYQDVPPPVGRPPQDWSQNAPPPPPRRDEVLGPATPDRDDGHERQRPWRHFPQRPYDSRVDGELQSK